MAHANQGLIERFYEAFGRLDGDAMAACYAPGAHFSDPVFVDLEGAEPGAMWRMLTRRARDFKVRLAESEAGAERGSAHWLADYTFSTGRRVHNDVRAEFQFRDGLIADHRTRSRSTRGPARRSARWDRVGWTPLLQAKVRREARAGLDAFLAGAPA